MYLNDFWAVPEEEILVFKRNDQLYSPLTVAILKDGLLDQPTAALNNCSYVLQ